MKNWIFVTLLLSLLSCKEKNASSYFTTEKASRYFSEIEEICKRDSGKLWGENLYGPIIFVDRTNRRMMANSPDKEGLLKSKDGVYTGLYPKELLISNAPVVFGGTQYAMTPLLEADDEYRIKTRAIHSLFHRFQEKHGIASKMFNANNMDEKEARLFIKLEWKALRKAIITEGEESQLAIRDALIFRGSNRELFHKYAAEENRFEAYEGLAAFTFTKLCTNTPEEYKTQLFDLLDRVYSMESYSRSYGGIHGALYATLLYKKGYDIRQIKTDSFDLGDEVRKLYNIELPVICRDVGGSLAVNYGVDEIIKEE
jgi:hypothetical protein